jgi:UDP-N-acetylmuramoyl-tripeptide--D-alanyl-D-alanine ligase
VGGVAAPAGWQTAGVDWTPEQVLAATGGRLVRGAAAARRTSFAAVTTDSRSVVPGGLFVPIRAARDGHDFVRSAVAAGAAGFLVAAGHPLGDDLPEGITIEVEDTAAALLDLGRAARQRLDGPVVGITGSVGKTSTKDLAAASLGAAMRVTASERSLNNELGVPLTLANADPATQVAVIEMGARGRGHIAMLCGVAAPTVGVVTAVAAVHTELFGSLDAVAVAKAELVEALPASGLAVLNTDDRRVAEMARVSEAPVLGYSAGGDPGADVTAAGVRLDDELRARFELLSPWGRAEIRLAARGAHQVGNALAAATVALHHGVGLADVADALGSASLSPWRMELVRTPGGATVINDAYNANPASVTAALQALAALPARRRTAVLGEMAELGAEGPAEHLAAARLAARLDIRVVAVGTDAYGLDPVADIEEALDVLGTPEEGEAILVKGSRVAGLERLAAALVAGR